MTILKIEKIMLTKIRYHLVFDFIKNTFSWTTRSIKQMYYGYDSWEDDYEGWDDIQLHRLGFDVNEE